MSLDVGGIETALVALLNYLINEYEITLVLEKKQGIFLDKLDERIKIITFTPNCNKFVLLRKTINFIKQIKFKKLYKGKFDFSCSYATYSNSAAFTARTASENSALWCHMDYMEMFNNNENKVKQFFFEKKYEKFKHLIFVSEEAENSFLSVFPQEKGKTICINNLINYDEIIEKSNEEVQDLKKEEGKIIFINIGRHDEEQKRLSRIIEATKLLPANMNFQVILIGDGKDSKNYKDKVQEYNLNEKIKFLGRKENPYPYLKMADCMILTSDYEGFPVVFVESLVLEKPVITTKVSGVQKLQEVGKAIVIEKNEKEIAKAMKDFIECPVRAKKFDFRKYNEDIIKKLEKIIER